MEKLPPTHELYCENNRDDDDDDDDNDTVSDEHVMPPPNHEDALQCVSQLIKYSSAHQPQFMNDLFLHVPIGSILEHSSSSTVSPYLLRNYLHMHKLHVHRQSHVLQILK
jgi:hypothetical protein